MIQLNEIYRCNVCGNITEVVYPSMGELSCCGQAMELLEERQLDMGKEKHIPIIEKTNNGILVKVGEVTHPSEEEHYISIIELIDDDKIYRKTLKPGDKPEALFPVTTDPAQLKAREYCTVHGLWPSD